MTDLHTKLVKMLMIIWLGVSASFKSRYRMTIWSQFEDQIRSAAYTGSLSKWISSLCYKLDADIGSNAEQRSRFDALLRELHGQDREALKLLREEATLLVLMVRVANQERRSAWEAEHADDLFHLEGD